MPRPIGRSMLRPYSGFKSLINSQSIIHPPLESGNRRDAGAHLKRLIEMDKSALPADGGERYNRLIFADSPYLLQHAENPVDWYQWGEAAFAKAAAEEKPLFLSIGYATCHWCHVMAHESFEDREVAEVLNLHYVAIKVDREERPDIDDQFMSVAQIFFFYGCCALRDINSFPTRRSSA